MGADDDTDCEHLWDVEGVQVTGRGAALEHVCRRCGTVSYEASAADDPRRPPL